MRHVTVFKLQVDLRHIDEVNDTNVVEVGVDLSEFYTSVEWDILEVPAVRNEKFYTCCDEPYLDITFNITMRRKTLFYTVNLIIPCMGISFLTILVFYLPSDSGEKNFTEENYQCIQQCNTKNTHHNKVGHGWGF
ncbi:acetylcholine receptor protein alpha 1, 2, 3, 4 [Culex quinquefasciatus]|uniref:Acetylcholine receptor protein alpha 1, 2, 3, 4 n=1 Tax=Culex quinquefasciatus TaxID=7176 RepID=B0X7F5_CULQU|nr:acetylcholine receptor protein alpha 1, 2, 3, 4 [Culex quinquefasciatus]|eukprot:XP_001865577.1 acetylcholine receptor protein alpha 1, 2, 3, 4 [Culex quinquefasciatus]